MCVRVRVYVDSRLYLRNARRRVEARNGEGIKEISYDWMEEETRYIRDREKSREADAVDFSSIDSSVVSLILQ